MKKIKILEELKEKTYRIDDILGNLVLSEEEYSAIQNLIARYKELEKENKRIKSIDYIALAEEIENGLWMPRCDVEEYYIPIENLEDYIPKSKVKEKIEELKKEMEKDETDEFGIHSIGWGCLDYTIDRLQELLED